MRDPPREKTGPFSVLVSRWQDDRIDDVNDAIACNHIRGNHLGRTVQYDTVHSINHDLAALNAVRIDFLADNSGSRDHARYDMIGENFNKFRLVFRL